MIKALGLDFGMKRIGVAVGQTISNTAEPLAIIPARDGIPDWALLNDLIDTWGITDIIVGLPLNSDGSEQEITKAARKFANRCNAKFSKPVHLVDERLTSKAAKQELITLQKRCPKHIDSLAAVLILETWLRNYRDDKEN